MNRLVLAIQVFVSLFFLLTGISKLLDPASFSLAVERYQLTGPALSWVAALWLPWLECLSAVCLWIRSSRQAALVSILGMLLVFQFAIGSALARGLDISCGCLGAGMESSLIFSFIRNFFLIGGLAFLIIKRPTTK